MKKIKLFQNIITILLILLSTLILSFSYYISHKFADQNIDEMIFYLASGLTGTSNEVISSALNSFIPPLLVIFFLLIIPILRIKKTKNSLEVGIRNKKINIQLFSENFLYRYRIIYALLIIMFSIGICYRMLGVGNYIERLSSYSSFIEDHYVSGNDVSLKFPEKKRNLIILFVESLENSMINKDKGGGWDYTVMPELESIAEKNVNFSNSNFLGGAYPISGTGWTVAGMVAATSGLPLKIPIDGNEYTSSSDFMAGAYGLGDIFKKEGYSQSVMAGSDFAFGGRKNYYSKHGDYQIFDVNTAIKKGKMKENERVWWGFDDSLLFQWAKEEITSLSSSKQPFSFSVLTANTHFPDGYLEKNSENKYSTQYENVFSSSSKQIADFVEWFQKQNFYENTTLVILGDHLSMQPNGYFSLRVYKEYDRTIFNTFINPLTEPVQPHNRQFTSLDMFPTILASLGVEFKGNRLGLGTNLFSDRKTLVEELGLHYVDKELEKNSSFYNSHILRDDYLQLLEQVQKK